MKKNYKYEDIHKTMGKINNQIEVFRQAHLGIVEILDYISELEQQVKKQKEVIDKISKFCKNDKNFEILDLYSQDSVDEIQTNLLDILKGEK